MKNIYQVWFQGCDKIEKEIFRENIEKWKGLNKNWKYYCMKDEELRKMCYMYSKKCGEAYDKAQYMHAKIDLGKVVCVYLTGGIMVDMDMYALRSLDSYDDVKNFFNTNEQHKLGVSRLNINIFESLIFSGGIESYNNAVIISTKENPLLRIWIEEMINGILKIETKEENSGLYIYKTTGPSKFNSICTKKNRERSKVVVCPPTLFEPCEAFQDYCELKEHTISIHKFELSWLPKNMKAIGEVYYKYKLIIFVVIVMIIVSYLRRIF